MLQVPPSDGTGTSGTQRRAWWPDHALMSPSAAAQNPAPEAPGQAPCSPPRSTSAARTAMIVTTTQAGRVLETLLRIITSGVMPAGS